VFPGFGEVLGDERALRARIHGGAEVADGVAVGSIFERGQLEIYVQTFPEPGRKWKLSEDGGNLPLWSHDGTMICCWSNRRLIKVPIELQPTFQPARARQML
jgi:hypothetical protein